MTDLALLPDVAAHPYDKGDTHIMRVPYEVYAIVRDLSTTYGQPQAWWLNRIFWKGYEGSPELEP